MRHTIHTFFLLVVIMGAGCSTSRSVAQTPKPTYNITYKLITNAHFQHLDASYLNRTHVGVIKKDIQQQQMDMPIGAVASGFVASISSTGYGAKDSLASIELQIFKNGELVAQEKTFGLNPSIAVSYLVE